MSLPNLTSCDLPTVMWSFRLKRAVTFMAAGPIVTIANMAFVFEGGSDATGTLDRLDLPYATLAGAIADIAALPAPVPAYEILVGPGTFVGLSAITNGITDLAIRGMGPTATTLQPGVATSLITFVGATPMDNLLIEGMTIDMGATGVQAVQVDGTASAGACFASPGVCALQDLNLIGGNANDIIRLTAVNQVDVHDVSVITHGSVLFDRVAKSRCDNFTVFDNIRCIWDLNAAVTPSDGAQPSVFTATMCSTFTSSGNCKTVCESTVRVEDLVSNHADIDGPPAIVNHGWLRFHGYAETVTLTYNVTGFQVGPRKDVFNLVKSEVNGFFTVARLGAGTGAGRIAVAAQNITLHSQAFGSVAIDGYVDLDIRGGFFHQPALTNGDSYPYTPPFGTIDRQVHGWPAPVAVDSGNPIGIVPPFPTNATYGIIIEAAPAELTALPASTSVKQGDQFTITTADGGDHNLEITLVRPNIDLAFVP